MADRRLNILFMANRSPYPMKDGQTRRTYSILAVGGVPHLISDGTNGWIAKIESLYSEFHNR